MNIGRSEYNDLKEKEKDLRILLEKLEFTVIAFNGFQRQLNSDIKTTLKFEEAVFIADTFKKYKDRENERIQKKAE